MRAFVSDSQSRDSLYFISLGTRSRPHTHTETRAVTFCRRWHSALAFELQKQKVCIFLLSIHAATIPSSLCSQHLENISSHFSTVDKNLHSLRRRAQPAAGSRFENHLSPPSVTVKMFSGMDGKMKMVDFYWERKCSTAITKLLKAARFCFVFCVLFFSPP